MKIRFLMTLAVAAVFAAGESQAAFKISVTGFNNSTELAATTTYAYAEQSIGVTAFTYGTDLFANEAGDNAWKISKTGLNASTVPNFLTALLGSAATEMYKANRDDQAPPVTLTNESGTAAGYYTTSLSALLPDAGKIHWDGGSFIDASRKFAYFKDGNFDAYLFDISLWNGKDDIEWSGLWGQVKLSHVQIYAHGAPPENLDFLTEVPEPASIAMWLTMAVGGVFVAHRKSKKAVC